MSRIITLTTDFGTSDGFAGAMKGVILSLCPDAKIVDITHDVPPQDVLSGALALEAAAPTFPPNTIHVVVVDPGVGSERAALYLETRKHFFVGPDNGIFDLVSAGRFVRAMKLSQTELLNPAPSATFHGRDIFAPVAAHLANGTPIDHFAEPVTSLVRLMLPQPERKGADLEAHILHADRFGNLITDLKRFEYDDWNRENAAVELVIGGRRIEGISRTYADVKDGNMVAYFGSGNRLEIAVRNNSAQVLFQWSLAQARRQSVLLKKV
ncbi:MAG TPA: SAM-dependent chlorinase/fluorinase [Planctomycetota bacterium]|nr:SAM-dependent chlorinase/fluorinase [Planctomycetota bacterium]